MSDNCSWWVRIAVAENLSTPVDLLTKLAEDPDFWVRCMIARNPHTPLAILKKLQSDCPRSVAKNPSTPVDLLTKLTEDLNLWDRLAVAEDRYTSFTLLEILQKDEDASVRWSAQKNMQIRSINQNPLLAILEKLQDDVEKEKMLENLLKKYSDSIGRSNLKRNAQLIHLTIAITTLNRQAETFSSKIQVI